MGMRWVVGMIGLGVGLLVVSPSVKAADGPVAEAAEVGVSEASLEQIHAAIEATRQTDPELAQEMENQLKLLESGELDLRAEGGVPGGTTPEGNVARGIAGGLPGVGLVGPPVDGQQGEGMPSYMTPELREQLATVFDRRASGELTEEEARSQAEAILREHGVDPREIGPGHEGDWEHEAGQWQGDRGEGFERAYLEQMSPEAREQMERFFNEHEGEHPQTDRETFEREFGTYEAPPHEYEAPTHEYEVPTHEYEAPTHEYEAPEFEQPEYEMPPAPEYDYQPPQQP